MVISSLIVPLFDGYRQFYGQPGNLMVAEHFIAERLQGRDSVLLLAADAAGNGVGFVQLYPSFSSVSTARIFILNDLFVAPASRRDGVGRLLLASAAETARAAGAVRLSLSTAHDNVPAQKLYERLGCSLV